MVRMAIVDDAPEDRMQLRQLIRTVQKRMQLTPPDVSEFSDGSIFLKVFQPGMYDIIFLALHMKKMNGISVGTQIRQRDAATHIILVSAYNDFASESYRMQADYYLRKPYTENDFLRMLEKVNAELLSDARYIVLPNEIPITLNNIIYSEYFRRVVHFHCKDNQVLQCRMSQSRLEDMLTGKRDFCVSSRGIIVNIKEIERIDADTILMSNGDHVPYSRRRAKELKRRHAKYLFFTEQRSLV